jgi:hypothetical protein
VAEVVSDFSHTICPVSAPFLVVKYWTAASTNVRRNGLVLVAGEKQILVTAHEDFGLGIFGENED